MARNALDVAKEALRLWRANHGNASLDQQCQRYDGYYWQWAYQGNENIRTYSTATAAANASVMFTKNINDSSILPGDLVYWHWSSEGHVATVVGRDNGRTLVTHTSSKGDTVLSLSNNVKVSHADTIGLQFRGVSHTNGSNSRRTGLTAWNGSGGGGGGGSTNYGYGLTTAAQRAAQRALTHLKLYSGPIDGVFGVNSVKAMQQFLKNTNLLPKGYVVDGIPGPNYGGALQWLAKRYGYTGPLDQVPGAATSTGIEKWAAAALGEKVTAPSNPAPPVRPTPAAWEKVYPDTSSVAPSPNREPRKDGAVIGYVILHGTANLADHTGYFTRANEREVAPNMYARPSGEVKEFVRMGERAWTTAVPLDHQAVTWEIESDNTTYTDAQYEAIAKFCAWLSQQDTVDGVKVDFTIDAQRILGHKDVPGVTSGTSCPGALDIGRIIKRAKELVPPGERVMITREQLEEWRNIVASITAASEDVAGAMDKAFVS